MDYEHIARVTATQLEFMVGTYYANLYSTTTFQDLFNDVFNRRNELNYKFRHGLYMMVIIIYLIRAIIYDLTLNLKTVPHYAHGNFLLFAAHFLNERSMIKIGITFLLFALSSEWFTFFTSPVHHPWIMYYELFVVNIKYYNQASDQVTNMERMAIIKKRSLEICQENNISKNYHDSFIIYNYAKLRAFLDFDLIDKEYYKNCKLWVMDYCGFDVRRKTIIFLRFLEYFVAISQIFLFSLTYAMSMYYVNRNYYRDYYFIVPNILSLRYLRFCVDGITTFLLIIKLFQIGSNLVFYALASTLICSQISKESHKLLLKGYKIAQKWFDPRTNRNITFHHNRTYMEQAKKIRKLLLTFMRNNTKICQVMADQNDSPWSIMIFASFVTMFISNCYFISRIVLVSIHGPSLMLMISAIFLQLSIMAITLTPLAYTNKCFHSPSKHIPKTIICLPRINIMMTLKWKLLANYERLTKGPKYGTKIGVIGTITYKLLFEIVFIYMAYFLTFLKVLD